MRPFLVACVLALAVSCVLNTKQDDPLAYSRLVRSSETFTAQDSVVDQDKVYVSIEVVFHAIQAEKYPLTAKALKDALNTWASNLPIRLTVYEEDPRPQESSLFPFPVKNPSILGKFGIIQVVMDDLQSSSISLPDGILGIWQPEDKKIFLDADFLETDPELAYSVCLHEIGHLFGVPHVVNMNQSAPTGFLVLPEGEAAEDYVMYPGYVPGKKQDKLSDIEISIAQNHVLHHMTNTWIDLKKEDCMFTLEH